LAISRVSSLLDKKFTDEMDIRIEYMSNNRFFSRRLKIRAVKAQIKNIKNRIYKFLDD